ncbi:hypothetical protein ACP70R_008865 [Stipagrostis hirtigluma subsp. patula]
MEVHGDVVEAKTFVLISFRRAGEFDPPEDGVASSAVIAKKMLLCLPRSGRNKSTRRSVAVPASQYTLSISLSLAAPSGGLLAGRLPVRQRFRRGGASVLRRCSGRPDEKLLF